MLTTTTTTTTTQRPENPIAVTPTALWKPLPIERDIPPAYKTPRFGFQVVPLHPSFGCELSGVDFGKRVTLQEALEIREVVDKVEQLVITASISDMRISMELSFFGRLP
jgi:hypothetical protein